MPLIHIFYSYDCEQIKKLFSIVVLLVAKTNQRRSSLNTFRDQENESLFFDVIYEFSSVVFLQLSELQLFLLILSIKGLENPH